MNVDPPRFLAASADRRTIVALQDTASDVLPSWTHGPLKQSIVDFVDRVTQADGPAFVAAEARVAVFDNDGTLWCEKPLPVQAAFLFRRIGEMAQEDPELRNRQPWKAVSEGDYTLAGQRHHQALRR